MVLEFVQGGELFTYLRSVTKFSQHQAKFYAGIITLIFEHLHLKNIVYRQAQIKLILSRDLKPENLLITGDGYLKLTDFGFAKKIDGKTYTLCGTPEYLAPEMLLNKGHSKAVDWWTLGILIYEMLVGIDPFSDEDPMVVYQKILQGKLTFPKDFDRYSICSMLFRDAKSIIKRLLQIDLSKRLGNLKNGTNDVKNHRFFNEFSWQGCLEKKLSSPYSPIFK